MSVLCGLVLVQAFSGGLLGCGAGSGSAETETGSVSEVNLALTALPSGVQCIQVNVTSGSTSLASQNFTAAANWTATVGLGTTFTKGTVSVGANAYNAACSALAGATPTWVSDAVSVDVTPGRPNPVTLNLRQNFGVSASANFAPTVVDIATGSLSTGVVLADGTVKVVGWNVPQPTGLTSVVELALGYSHGCARKSDGTVWCWGSNSYGELGNGTTNNSGAVPVEVPGITGATRLAASVANSCATVAPNDTLKCWGYNYTNAFMDGNNSNRLTPSTVNNGPATKVSLAGATGALCFISSANLVVWCGGSNSGGELGAGDTVSHPAGAQAGALSAQSITVGGGHACAAGPDGRVRCWGANFSGELGLNNQTNSSVPVVLPTLTGVEEVAASDSSTCARTVVGVVYCWGDNYYGEVGDGTNVQRLSPVQVLTGSKKLRAGGSHMCSLQADASVKCWGYNDFGQLLDGTTATSDVPVPAKL
jgi:alpha-tubulin suppressor-like RCC1 family protein